MFDSSNIILERKCLHIIECELIDIVHLLTQHIEHSA